MANQFLGLSMFIMLLSFFIMLNSLSNFEDIKSKPVLNSLSLAFSSDKKNKGQQEQILVPDFGIEEEGLDSGDTLDDIEALFKAQISGYKIKRDRVGSSMHVRLPIRILERAISAAKQTVDAPNKTRNLFLPTLVSLMQSGDSSAMYRMDMVLNVQNDPVRIQNKSPEKALEFVRAASLFSQGLEEAGLPKN